MIIGTEKSKTPYRVNKAQPTELIMRSVLISFIIKETKITAEAMYPMISVKLKVMVSM